MKLHEAKTFIEGLSFFQKKPPEKQLSATEYAALLKSKYPVVNRMILIQSKLNYYHKNKLTPPQELIDQYNKAEYELDELHLVDSFLQDIEVTKKLKLYSYLRDVKEFEKQIKKHNYDSYDN